MKNTDDILKRILLNMKYDPKKSLVENKIVIIKESPEDPTDIKYDTATDGSTLELPSDAKVLRRWDTSKIVNLSPQEFSEVVPALSNSCKILYPKDIDGCLNNYKQKFINSIKNNSVSSFTAYDKTYKSCYVNTYVNKNTGKLAPLPPETITFFSSYDTDCKNRVDPWNGVTKKDIKDPNVKTPTGNKFVIDTPNAISNEYDMSTRISFDLEL
jgi:hypothetical protein